MSPSKRQGITGLNAGDWLCRGQRQVIYAAPEAIAIVDRDGRIIELNEQLTRLFGYREPELRNQTIDLLVPDRLRARHRRHFRDYDGAPKTCTMGSGLELFGRRKDGSEFPVEVRLSPMQATGGLLYIAIVRDVSEQKRACDELRSSLDAQGALLNEVHHRMQNNMQVISSLLRLQSDTVADAGARAALAESLSRVQAIALTHEILRHTKAVPQVNLAGYAARLIAEILHIYGATPEKVTVGLSIPPIRLPFEAAVKLGLVLNELLSNALKHAFRGKDGGHIGVRADMLPGGAFELSVSDDGAGLPSGFDPGRPETLGLQIVNNLATQLGASLSWSRGPGTTCTVRLPVACGVNPSPEP